MKKFVLLAAFALSTIAPASAQSPAAVTTCTAPLKPALEVNLYFGRDIETGGEVSEAQWAEFMNAEVTLRFHHKKLRPDSGGPGRHRGGLGQEILIESRSDTPIAVSFLAERTIFPAFGIEGGRDGAPGELHINGLKTDPKKQYVLNKGDTVSLGTPGGGGHGDPKTRAERALAADVAAGYVTDRAAYRG